jgi:hypothetical protein
MSSMRLYMKVPAQYARGVIERGFTSGRKMHMLASDDAGEFIRTEDGDLIPMVGEILEFRDSPPIQWAGDAETARGSDVLDRGTSDPAQQPDDDPDEAVREFVLSLEVPEDFALQREARSEPPKDLPFREIWLAVAEANRYLETLRVWDDQGVEVQHD